MASWQLTAHILPQDQRPQWRRTLERCPWRNVLARDLWLDLWPNPWGELLPIALYSGEELVGGILLTRRRRYGQSVLDTHPMVPYAGFWLADPEGASASKRESFHAAALDTLDDFLSRQCGKAVIRFDPRFVDLRLLIQRGWQIWVKYTYISDPREPLLSTFENDTRRQIDAARGKGIRVQRESDAAVFAQLARQTHERKALNATFPESYLENLTESLQREQTGALFIARSLENEPLAGALIGWEGDNAIYLYGGSAEPAHGTGAPSLLQLVILGELAHQGIATYDWHGANTPSVIRFKKNFNPRLQPCLVARKCYGLMSTVGHAINDGLTRWRKSRT